MEPGGGQSTAVWSRGVADSVGWLRTWAGRDRFARYMAGSHGRELPVPGRLRLRDGTAPQSGRWWLTTTTSCRLGRQTPSRCRAGYRGRLDGCAQDTGITNVRERRDRHGRTDCRCTRISRHAAAVEDARSLARDRGGGHLDLNGWACVCPTLEELDSARLD